MRELPIDKTTGKKMYPLGEYEKCESIFFNHSLNCFSRMAEGRFKGEAVKHYDRSLHYIKVLTENTIDGVSYALYEDYRDMKDIIFDYMVRNQ